MRYELAGRRVHGDWSRWTRRWLGVTSSADWLEFSDPHRGTYRAALLRDDRLHTSIFIAPYAGLPSRAWLSSLFAKDKLTRSERAGLLLGDPPAATEDPGPIVCSCFKIGRHTLARAIERQGLTTPAAVGTALRAGTNCGSCAGEIRQLIAGVQARAAP
jgi:assimilatory nitrate reductase catalytic subunit